MQHEFGDDQTVRLSTRHTVALLRIVAAAIEGGEVVQALARVEHALALSLSEVVVPGAMAGDLAEAWMQVELASRAYKQSRVATEMTASQPRPAEH